MNRLDFLRAPGVLEAINEIAILDAHEREVLNLSEYLLAALDLMRGRMPEAGYRWRDPEEGARFAAEWARLPARLQQQLWQRAVQTCPSEDITAVNVVPR